MLPINNEDAIKYETGNPISKFLLKNFFISLEKLLVNNGGGGVDSADSIYEAGCGSGYVTACLKNMYPDASITAIDIDAGKIAMARERVNDIEFNTGSIYDTGKPDNSFDIVISTEVLEHLERPADALQELLRISKRYVLISTPNEPLWRIANMARLKYLGSLGNTPGHINHWSSSSLKRFAQRYCDVRAVLTPPPWVMLLCEKRR